MVDSDFRELVKAKLNENNISAAALARRIGVSHETIYRWLRDPEKELGSNKLEMICRLLGIKAS